MKKRNVVCVIVLVILAWLGNVELRQPYVCSSSIFSTPAKTEIQMYVLINSLLPVNEEVLVKEIIDSEQKLNGKRENPIYTLQFYRTRFHYQHEWEYSSLTCNEEGIIICDNDKSVL